MRNKKFTLIELIMAIIVIGILAAIILLNISKLKDRALDTAKLVNLSEMQKIVDMYYLERDMYPTIVQPTMGPEKVEQDLLVTDFQKKKIKEEFCVKPTGEVIFFDDCESVSLDDLPIPVDVLTCEQAIQAGYEKCISNQEDLKSIQEGLYSKYIIVNDFNITGEWTPIVLPNINTSVELNGNGYAISDLFINTTANNSGMFSKSNNITIKNLKLTNSKMNVNGHSNSGLLVGETNGSVILDNISITSEITGIGDYVGSLIGSLNNTDGRTFDSNSTNIVGQIKIDLTSGDYVGGLFGVNVGKIDSVNVDVHIKGSGTNYGGVSGIQPTVAENDNRSSNINVTGRIENNGNMTGGVFGGLYNGSGHTNISVKGTVVGVNMTGGLFGQAFSKLKDISFEGEVSGIYSTGGISGEGGYEKINDASNNIKVKGKIQGTGNYVGGVSGILRMGEPKGFNVDVIVKGDGQYVGGVFGEATSKISDVTGKVNITGMSGHVGGLAGQVNTGLDNVQLKGEVYGAGSNIGGISGQSNNPITNIHYEGIVNSLNSEKSSYEGLGGIVGLSTSSIDNASFKGSIVANETRVGGITGKISSSLTNVSVTGSIENTNGYLGGIVGEANGLIQNAILDGNIKSTYGDYVGGLAGKQTGDTRNVTINADVSSTGNYTGGVIGHNSSHMSKLIFNGNLTSKGNYIGGIAGYSAASANLLGVVGSITAEGDYVGGILGENYSSIDNVYVIANITNTGNYTGGIVAKMLPDTVGKLYFSGTISGTNHVDPIFASIGEYSYNSIKNNPNAIMFWNSDLYASPTNGLGSGKTDAQLKDISTFTGWDFNNTWVLEDYLKFK